MMGIRNKLVLCLLAVLFPLVAVGMFATHLVDRQMVERTEAALANAQRLEVARIEQSLDNYADHARSLASGSHVRQFVSDLHDYRYGQLSTQHKESMVIGGQDDFALVDPESEWPLQQLALALQRKAGIMGTSVVEVRMMDRLGNTLGESLGFSWRPTDTRLIDRSMRTVKTMFGDAFRNDESQQRLGIVSPIISTTGEVVGALAMEARLGPIINMIAKHEAMGESIEAHVAQPTSNGDAQFITALRFDREAAFNKVVPSELDKPVNQALKSPDSQVIRSLDYRGVDSFMAFQTVSSTGWGVILKVDAAETYAPTEKLRNWLMWATAASISFVAIIYCFVFVPVVRQLKRVAGAAKHIADGNLSERLVDRGRDEISELASSINSLAKDLEEDHKIRIEVEARLHHQAIHDELTGLLNRKHANTVIDRLMSDHQSEHSVVFLDLNGFKGVNDLYGHAAGDEVLASVAKRLVKQVPQGATLARWGGDEFVVLMPGANEQQARDLALTLHSIFDEKIISSKGQHNIGCSIGLATSSEHKNLEDALLEADALMYEQKKQQQYQRSKGGVATRGVEKALIQNRMDMWFQPTLRIERPGNYELVGAATTMRMRTENGAYVSSDEFQPDLTDHLLIRGLDDHAIDMALNALRRWSIAGIVDKQFQLSIEISEHTLKDRRFPPTLSEKITSLELGSTQVQLEVQIAKYKPDKTVLAQLKQLGIPVALNGAGIEPNLLRDVPSTMPSQAIIGKPSTHDELVLRHLIDTCRELGVGVLAKEVDDREQLARLHAIGVTHFQGAIFENPVSAVDFVSRWGQTKLTGLGRAMSLSAALRLAG